MTGRSDTEILKDMIDAVLEYRAAVEDEMQYRADNGDPVCWTSEMEKEYGELSSGTLDALRGLEGLIREATGDEYFGF